MSQHILQHNTNNKLFNRCLLCINQNNSQSRTSIDSLDVTAIPKKKKSGSVFGRIAKAYNGIKHFVGISKQQRFVPSEKKHSKNKTELKHKDLKEKIWNDAVKSNKDNKDNFTSNDIYFDNHSVQASLSSFASNENDFTDEDFPPSPEDNYYSDESNTDIEEPKP